MNKVTDKIDSIKNDEIRTAVRHAVFVNLLPALTDSAYKGQFSVTCDGGGFGRENIWPGLDSWEIAGAYLLLNKTNEVLLYFDFVEAFQRSDGNIPFAIFPAEDCGEEIRSTYYKGLRYPEDIYEYTQPGTGYPTRKWIGLFTHWVPENPFGVLAPISYILTASEIYAAVKDDEWLKSKLPSLERAAQYILSQKSPNGLVGGAGFYTELPPRYKWDGITQCYTYEVFNIMKEFYAENKDKSDFWRKEADSVKAAFNSQYWTGSKYAEYIHPEHGAVDWHGYTDVDWAATAFGLADEGQKTVLVPALLSEKDFWWGGMPTQPVTRPYAYREWELSSYPGFDAGNGPLYDAAAMGRVWYLETRACLALKEFGRLKESALHVAKMGNRHGGKWFERYHMVQNRQVHPCGPAGYCEYAAVLVRTVLGNLSVFI